MITRLGIEGEMSVEVCLIKDKFWTQVLVYDETSHEFIEVGDKNEFYWPAGKKAIEECVDWVIKYTLREGDRKYLIDVLTIMKQQIVDTWSNSGLKKKGNK